MVMHFQMCIVLDYLPADSKFEEVPAKLKQVALDDWNHDTGEHDYLNYQRFMNCWFQLADQFTESIDRTEYIKFLDALVNRLLVRDPRTGKWAWKNNPFKTKKK